MTPIQIVAVAVRLFAICLALNDITIIPTYLFGSSPNSLVRLYSVLIGIVTFGVSLMLWFFPLTVARRLLPREPANAGLEEKSPDIWLAMGCALLGMWILSADIPKIVYEFASMALIDGYDRSQFSPWLIYRLLEVAIGLWLLLGAKGVREIFWWARTAGSKRPSNPRSSGRDHE